MAKGTATVVLLACTVLPMFSQNSWQNLCGAFEIAHLLLQHSIYLLTMYNLSKVFQPTPRRQHQSMLQDCKCKVEKLVFFVLGTRICKRGLCSRKKLLQYASNFFSFDLFLQPYSERYNLSENVLLWYARSQVSNNDHISLSCCWGPIQISRHAKNAKFYPYLPTCHASVTLGKYPTYLPSRVTVLSQFSAKTHILRVVGFSLLEEGHLRVFEHIRLVWRKESTFARNKSDNFCTTLSLTLPLFSCFWLRHVTLTHDPTYLCVTLLSRWRQDLPT